MTGYLGNLGNFPDTQAFGKFPRYPGIWKVSQIPFQTMTSVIIKYYKFEISKVYDIGFKR